MMMDFRSAVERRSPAPVASPVTLPAVLIVAGIGLLSYWLFGLGVSVLAFRALNARDV